MKREIRRVKSSRELNKRSKEHKKAKGVYSKPETFDEMMEKWRKNGSRIK